MRIILFTDSLGAGGAQRQLVGLAQLLQGQGYDVVVLTYHKDEFYLPFLREHNVKYVLLENSQRALQRIFKIIKYVKKEKPGALIAFQETPSLIACIVKIILPSLKIFVSERSTTQTLDFRTKIRFFLYRWADRIVPNSYSQANYIKQYNPKFCNKIAVVTNFVDLQKFSPVEKSRKLRPVIMVAASIWPTKNTVGFIDAMKMVRDRGYDFEVRWYGKSESNLNYFNKAQARINELGLEDCIYLLEKSKDIKSRYDEADYFCLPSFYEGTPNVICEAIACGLPVICSDVCDNSIYVHKGINGMLFNPRSPQSMADGISCMLSLSDLQYTEYCRKSRLIAEEKLSSALFLDKYQSIILN